MLQVVSDELKRVYKSPVSIKANERNPGLRMNE